MRVGRTARSLLGLLLLPGALFYALSDVFVTEPARGIGGALVLIALLAYAGLFSNPSAAAELGYRGQWAVDAGLGTPVLLVGGLLLWRRAPLGYVTAAPLLFVSAIGGLAFAPAAVLDRVLSGTAIDPAVVWVHLGILVVDGALLAVFLQHRGRAATSSVGFAAVRLSDPPMTRTGSTR